MHELMNVEMGGLFVTIVGGDAHCQALPLHYSVTPG